MVHREVQELAEMIHRALKVGVEEGAVAFAAAPENVAGAVEGMGYLDGLFDLGGGVSENIGIAIRGRPLCKARMGKQAGRAPQQPHTRALLFLPEHLDDGIQVLVGFAEVPALGCHVTVVERVEGRAEFLEELERDADARLRHFQRVGAVFPGPHGCARAEHIGQLAPDGVPVGDGKAQVVFHRLAFDQLLGIVMLESQRVFRGWPFELNLGNAREEFSGLFFHDGKQFSGARLMMDLEESKGRSRK